RGGAAGAGWAAALAAASSPARKLESHARCSRLDLLTMVLSAAMSSRENGAKLGTRATFDIILSARNAIDNWRAWRSSARDPVEGGGNILGCLLPLILA